jgi:hypothetical protein
VFLISLGVQTLTFSLYVRRARGILVVAGLTERVAQPLETLVQTVTGCSASGLDVLEAILAQRFKEGCRVNVPKRVVGGCEGQACR